MKKSAVRQEGDGDVSDTPKKSTIPSLIQADLIEPTGRRPSSYESSEPDRSETGSNRGNRKLIAPPEPEIGLVLLRVVWLFGNFICAIFSPFVNRGGRPHRNDRNYQNYPNDREEYSNRRYGQQQDYFDVS